MSEHGKNNQAHSGVAVDSDGLLVCPFCGSSAREEQTRGSFGGYRLTTVYCLQCGASAPSKETWNKRVGQ